MCFLFTSGTTIRTWSKVPDQVPYTSQYALSRVCCRLTSMASYAEKDKHSSNHQSNLSQGWGHRHGSVGKGTVLASRLLLFKFLAQFKQNTDTNFQKVICVYSILKISCYFPHTSLPEAAMLASKTRFLFKIIVLFRKNTKNDSYVWLDL